jgi:hypothetical protein
MTITECESTLQTIADLTAAAALFDTNELTKAQYTTPAGGAFCTVGALLHALGLASIYDLGSGDQDSRFGRAVCALADTLGVQYDREDQVEARSYLYDFNDADVTVKADVQGLFRTTISRLRG